MMSVVVFLCFVGVVLVAGGALLGWFAWQNFQKASRLDRPLSRVAKLRPGFHKVRGRIAPIGEPLLGPVTNHPCVYYRLCVYEDQDKSRSPAGSDEGAAVARFLGGGAGILMHKVATSLEQGDVPFAPSSQTLVDDASSILLTVEDDTGTVEVDLRGATVIPKEKARIDSGLGGGIPVKLADWVRKEYGIHMVNERGWVKSCQFVEEALRVGAKVTVVGPVEAAKNGNLRFRSKGDTLVVSERDIGKEGQETRGRALGLCAGAGVALALALMALIGAAIIAVQAFVARP